MWDCLNFSLTLVPWLASSPALHTYMDNSRRYSPQSSTTWVTSELLYLLISRWFLTGWELNLFYLVHLQGGWEQGALPPESVHVDIEWLSVRKNTADTDACVSEKSCHSQWMGGSDPYPSIVPCEYIRQHVDHCHSHDAHIWKRGRCGRSL